MSVQAIDPIRKTFGRFFRPVFL